MQQGQHNVTAALARALIAAQMPDLAALPLRRVGVAGTDNVLFRLGRDLVARFPRLPHAEVQIAVLARWLPGVAPLVPVDVPLGQRFGQAGPGYPFAWSVGRWLPGRTAFNALPELGSAAQTMAQMLRALQAHPVPQGAPQHGVSYRLDLRLGGAEHFIAQITEFSDHAPLYRMLAQARALPSRTGPGVWVHGDLHPLNLLVRRGRISAVIDWGSLGVGDPAVDMMLGWTLFDAPSRAVFRAAMAPSTGDWARARAMAFAKAIVALPCYRHSNPAFHAVMARTLGQVMLDAA